MRVIHRGHLNPMVKTISGPQIQGALRRSAGQAGRRRILVFLLEISLKGRLGFLGMCSLWFFS